MTKIKANYINKTKHDNRGNQGFKSKVFCLKYNFKIYSHKKFMTQNNKNNQYRLIL